MITPQPITGGVSRLAVNKTNFRPSCTFIQLILTIKCSLFLFKDNRNNKSKIFFCVLFIATDDESPFVVLSMQIYGQQPIII